MNRFVTNFAASTMVIAMTMAGCQADTFLTTASAATGERGEQQAQRFAEQARAAVGRGDAPAALTAAERAVELAPRDAGYRMLLADVYLKAGRFRSAEASYADVLAIDGGNVRASLSLALVQIAQGRSADALVSIEAVQDSAPPSDVGLAFALAGQSQRAIALLEPAARAAGANGRTRQNLALAYAFAGDWQRARTVAAQDVSPAELGRRLEQWAALARPAAHDDAVATLLGVTRAEDPGQPVRLALSRPLPANEAYAQAAPVADAPVAEAPVQLASNDVFASAPAADEDAAPEEPAAPAAVAETIRYAEAPVVVSPASPPAPVAADSDQSGSWWPAEGSSTPAPAPAAVGAPVRYAAAPVPVVSDDAPAPAAVAAVLSAPSPVLARSVAPARTSRPVFRPAPVNRAASISAHFPRPGSGTGNFVVQLGAFANSGNAERAWSAAQRRFGLSEGQARTASVTMGGRTLTRVSVAGFSTRAEAARLCSALQAQGGSCFVRGVAGDAPVRWASRSTAARRS